MDLNQLKQELLHNITKIINRESNVLEEGQFNNNIDDLCKVCHIFPSNYIGFEGEYNSNDIIKVFKHYAKQNNLNLGEMSLNTIDKLEEEYFELESQLKSNLNEFISKTDDKLLVISVTKLNKTELDTYLDLINKIQGSENVSVSFSTDDKNLNQNISHKFDSQYVENAINTIDNYYTDYVLVAKNDAIPYLISQFDSQTNQDSNYDMSLIKIVIF